MATVLITGGSRGIGRACVEYFCNRGDRVAFLYRANEKAAREVSEKTGALGLCVDVSEPEAVTDAIDRVRREYGKIDILVSNAGIAQIKLFTEITNEDWRRMIDTNLSGAFYVAREVAKDMISKQGGSIVFVGSMWGKVGASCEVHYSASKAALRGMTLALAKELGPSHITVNCVEPGVIATDMNASLDEETLNSLCDQTPLCRLGRAEEVADAIGFLTSPNASFITGQIIGVDGGFAL